MTKKLLLILALLPLMTSAVVTKQASATDGLTPTGWGAGTDGGRGENATVVTNYAELQKALTANDTLRQTVYLKGRIDVPGLFRVKGAANKTIVGLTGSALVNDKYTVNRNSTGILMLDGCRNIVLQNITFIGPGAFDRDANDNLCVTRSKHIWVDHCDFQDGMDGNFDCNMGSDSITVSWCRFRYLRQPWAKLADDQNDDHNSDHRFSNLWGSSDREGFRSEGRLRTTFDHCWWDEGCRARMPFARFGQIHLLNCLYTSSVATVYVQARYRSNILVEGCAFIGTPDGAHIFQTPSSANTEYQDYNIRFKNCLGTPDMEQRHGNTDYFVPSYTYQPTSTSRVEADVKAAAGATLKISREPTTEYSPTTNINRSGYPRVLADGSVMFRVQAPQAQTVQIDIGGTKYDMTKTEGGVWTVTTKPQVPGFHYYSLVVNGVSVADPASQSFFGCSRWSSAIEIPEAGMDDFEVQDVPHGEVRTVWYYSKVDESWRPLMVYTPAGYNESRQTYPVVYIQHGGGEDHRGWMEQGRTAQIMDNLIAQGKAVPMIVVSSNSNVRSRSGGMGGGYSWQGMQTFRSELIDNVIPFVENNFRVRKDRKSRAMCGLSMGGGQSFYIGLRSPEVFANVGVFSTGMFGGIRGASNFDLEAEVPGMLTDTKTFNGQLDVFFVSCGEQDPRIEYTRSIVKKMRDAGVNVRFNSYPGDHEWQVWRKSLHEFAQYLFK